ncbi:Very-long-chain (3R)-3-hydroxyacyl-CoA dehydratase 2 [Halotydeus destructor]|nr:Very-long-chain (3R)-3-hydroxyacyl-CoA dehydratase 2 [Halotydeus destructor]
MGLTAVKIYLIAYNLVLLAISITALVKILKYNISDGFKLKDFPLAGSYGQASHYVRILFIVQFMEILHTILGFTKGSPVMGVVQVMARGLVFFAFMEAEPKVQNNRTSGLLLVVWCMGDIARYPFYILKLMDVELFPVTWLRYTAWIVLYPMGITLEGVVAYYNKEHLEKTGRFSYPMPNLTNFAFHMSSFLYYYLPLLPLGGLNMMYYMKSQRAKVLNSSKPKRD